MALLANWSIWNSNLGNEVGGPIYNSYSRITNLGSAFDFYCGYHVKVGETNKACFPTGSEPPYSRILAPKGVEMSCTTSIEGSGVLSNQLATAINLVSSLSGGGDLVNNMGLIVQLACSLSGSGDITNAQMKGIVNMVCNLSGGGELTNAQMSMIVSMICDLSGSGDVTANLRGLANMSASLYVNESTVTIQQTVNGVLDAMLSDHQIAGSVGKGISLASSGGVDYGALATAVWETLSSGQVADGSMAVLLKDIALKAEEIHKIQGALKGSDVKHKQGSIEVDDITILVTGDENETILSRQ